MIATELGIDILLMFAVACLSSTVAETPIPAKKLLLDTDAGGDDAFAIMMAIQAEEMDRGIEIIGITCVNGNAEVDHVVLNVLKTLKVADRLDIPVYKGGSHPLLLPNERDNYFGKDGFGDFYYPDPPSVDLIQSKHAVNAMIDLVQANPGEVTLLALGPLTNIALAIRLYPSFVDELKELIIMGGSTESRGNWRPSIEFNFSVDPVANYIVLSSTTSKPAILLPWETNRKTHVSLEFRRSLGGSNYNKTWLINSADRVIPGSNFDYWECPDALVIAIALTSGSIITKSETYYAEAIHTGSKTAGMIIVDYANVTGNAANIKLVQDISEDIFKKLLLRYFSN